MRATRRPLRDKLPCPRLGADWLGLRGPRVGRVLPGVLAAALLACSLTGCSLFVMAGKALFGDPVRECAFRQVAHVDLTKGKKRVLVYCAAPHHVLSQYDAIDYEMVDRISRHLQSRGIPTVNSNDVKAWMDKNGPLRHARDLAADFETDYIIEIELKQFTQHEDNSDLYRGTLSGYVTVWEVAVENEQKRAWDVYSSEFTSVYPDFTPLSRHQISSPEVFVRTCIAEASLDLAQMFYDHRASETVR